MTSIRTVVLAVSMLVLVGCAQWQPMQQPLPLDEVLKSRATAGPLRPADAVLIGDNDAAFAAKLAAVEGARSELDLAYYIFSSDHSSSRLAQALIAAARRGVRVRLLVDYFSGYRELDHLSWLEQQGAGRIEVRLYNRPTLPIVKDAAYLTLACADVGVAQPPCDRQKIAAIDAHFAQPGALRAENRQFAGSAVFLSGLYGKHPKLMAYAITRGQSIDAGALAAGASAADAERTEQLKRLGKLYFKARYVGGVDGIAARLQLAMLRLFIGDKVNPVLDAINAYLPLTREDAAPARRDWDYLTEFLHHKFLLADRRTLVLGGRNVEDAYHLQPSPLSARYTFIDTDARLDFGSAVPSLTASFDRLWTLPGMVATLPEVRAHAPNDLLENFDALAAAQDACDAGRDLPCVDREVERRFVPLPQRLVQIGEQHQARLARLAADYRPAPAADAALPIDPGAEIHYLENLPHANGQRVYGARPGREIASNKNIHALWRSALRTVCSAPGAPARDVVFHNAYLLLPSDLLRDVAAALDGSRPCPDVRLVMLTNSLETTDLNIVNLLATWQLKALADHLGAAGRRPGAATLHYHEYQVVPGRQHVSLHSKVMLFDRDIFIGSANADLRSLMMDTNNGVLIRAAPRFADALHQRVRQLIGSPGVADRTAQLGRPEAELAAEMNALIDQMLVRWSSEDRLSAAQQEDLRREVRATTQRVYQLTRRLLGGDPEAAEEFDSLFKAI